MENDQHDSSNCTFSCPALVLRQVLYKLSQYKTLLTNLDRFEMFQERVLPLNLGLTPTFVLNSNAFVAEFYPYLVLWNLTSDTDPQEDQLQW